MKIVQTLFVFVKVLVVLRGKVRKKEEEVVMLDNKEVAMMGKREVNHQEDKPTLRKTRSLTRADEQHQREMEEKVKVTEETEKEISHMPKISNNGFAKKKATKRSLDKVLVDLKARVGPDAKDAEPEVIEVELEEKSVNIKSLNVKDAAEAQQIIRDLTSQLSKREDEYVEMKAENLSKDQKIRALEQNLGKLDQKFECFKNDREELQKYMKMNVDLIKKLDVLGRHTLTVGELVVAA